MLIKAMGPKDDQAGYTTLELIVVLLLVLILVGLAFWFK